MTSAIATSLAAVRRNECYGAYADGLSRVYYVQRETIQVDGFSGATTRIDTSKWYRVQINASVPSVMDATSKGTLFASFTTGNFAGTCKYNPNNRTWTRLTRNAALDIAAVDHEGLYTADYTQFFATYSTGTWSYNGRWTHMDSVAATNIAADDDNFVGSFDGNSVWQWDRWARAWSQIDDSSAALLG
jgi:hypothetical protein